MAFPPKGKTVKAPAAPQRSMPAAPMGGAPMGGAGFKKGGVISSPAVKRAKGGKIGKRGC